MIRYNIDLITPALGARPARGTAHGNEHPHEPTCCLICVSATSPQSVTQPMHQHQDRVDFPTPTACTQQADSSQTVTSVCCRYAAPPWCSRTTVAPCSASINLHASVLPQQMGKKVIPILWSTGVRDNLYVSLLTTQF